ncbi:MAG: serine/threonine-protein phosphatase [Planctomycetaceae bacterium]|nr:serine/threonine-protein phosphatase [Planctomycetaceae bacterium]
MNWDDSLQHAEVSDIGLRRTTNQDAYAVVLANDMEAWRRSGHLFVVADGMGAHAAGELASELAVSGIAHRYPKYHDLSPPEALHRAIQETNAEVHQRGRANVDFHNMGTTASVLALLPQGALVAHVGDSRVYRVRGRILEQLTFDHSLVWELREHAQSEEHAEFASVVPKNIITRSLGPNSTVQTDFEGPFPLEVGDTFLLCSDGLTGLVKDEEIGPILASLPPREAAQALIDLANLRGGHDNITALVVRVTGQELTTRVAAAQPLTILRSHTHRKLQTALWIGASVCFLAALAMAVLGQRSPALIALAGGVITALVAVVQQWVTSSRGITLGESRRLGRGPHVRIECPVNGEFVGKLAGLVDQLRSATEDGNWKVDLSGFNQHASHAQQASREKKHQEALQHYMHAISYMMAELREQSRRTGETPL